jgi:hypothetical protein
MKMKNKKANIPFLAQGTRIIFQFWWVIALFVILYFGFMYSGDIIVMYGSDAYEPKVETASWQGAELTLTAPAFGSLTNGDKNQFCGSDGDVTLTNSYQASGTLILSSSMSGNMRECSGNYLTATIIIPPGTLSGTCDVTSTAYDMGGSFGRCDVSYPSKSFSFEHAVSSWELKDGKLPISKSSQFEYTFTEPTEIKVKLSSGTAYRGTGEAKLSMSFVSSESSDPTSATQAETPSTNIKIVDCNANVDCIKTCGEQEPTCSENKCFCNNVERTNTEKVALQLSWFDRLVNAFQNLIDKIFGVFSK